MATRDLVMLLVGLVLLGAIMAGTYEIRSLRKSDEMRRAYLDTSKALLTVMTEIKVNTARLRYSTEVDVKRKPSYDYDDDQSWRTNVD